MTAFGEVEKQVLEAARTRLLQTSFSRQQNQRNQNVQDVNSQCKDGAEAERLASKASQGAGRDWVQCWYSTASSIGSTSTPSTQSPCKCSIRHRLRCSAARQPRPTRCGRNERPMHQDRGLAGAQLDPSAYSSTIVARHESAIAVADEMSQNMVTQAQEKWSMEIHQICDDVFGSGPKKTVQKLAATGQGGTPPTCGMQEGVLELSCLWVTCMACLRHGHLSVLRERNVAA